MKHHILLSALIFSLAVPAAVYSEETAPERIRITAAYGGAVTNKATYPYYDNTGTKHTGIIKDTGFMTGLFLQWVETDTFQANAFLYGAPDVNYSRVLGAHGNADGYFLSGSWGSLVAGVDVEDINIRLRAKSHLRANGYQNFSMDNNVLFLMGRAGIRIKASPLDSISCSLLPYAGITRETIDGSVAWDAASPMAPDGKQDIRDEENYFSWGTNLNIKIFHFIDLTAKYLGRAKKGEYLNSVTGQANIYFSHNVGISWQTKYMDISNDAYDLYNIFGVSLMF
jgi:hypothetical protein